MAQHSPAPSLARRWLTPLLALAIAVLAAGAVLAVAKPGNLDPDRDATETADDRNDDRDNADDEDTTTTEAAGEPTTAAGGGGPAPTGATTAAPPTTSAQGAGVTTTVPATTTAPPTTAPPTTARPGVTTTTAPSSGVGDDEPSVADGATADTGMESLLGPGLLVAATGAALRAGTRRRRA